MKIQTWTLFLGIVCCTTAVVGQQDGPKADFADHSIISRDVVVATDDTFQTIAKRELGRAGLAQQLADYNGLPESTQLKVGQIVRIPIHVPARKEFASVIFVKGTVLVQRGLKKDDTVVEAITVGVQHSDVSAVQVLPLNRNSEVYPGDTIDTGDNGFASIEFSSGSVINLQPDTEAIINRLTCQPADDSCVIDIKTLRGKVTSNVQSREDQPTDFRISTPYASAAVRGTVFDIEANPDGLIVGVTEGAVDLNSNTMDQALPLDVGFGNVVQEGAVPGDPIALLPAPVFKRIPARMAKGDTIDWWPNSQADKYGALVSNDEIGQEVLTSLQTDEQKLSLSNLGIGDYFFSLRAIDDNGLRGFRSSSRITIAEIDPNLETVDTTITKQGSEYLVEILNPVGTANGYEVQISDNRAFNDPLSTDIDPSGSAVFRINGDTVFTRARVLMDPFTVSAFGATKQSDD